MKPKRIVPQFTFAFEADTFNLAVEQTEDGERLSREKREAERLHREAKKQQQALELAG